MLINKLKTFTLSAKDMYICASLWIIQNHIPMNCANNIQQ